MPYSENPKMCNVYAGIVGNNIVGPFIINGNLNYLVILVNVERPALSLANVIWYQPQDGAPPHYAVRVQYWEQ